MANYTDDEIQQLAEEVHFQIEQDRKYVRETLEAYEAQKQRRLYEIIIAVVMSVYGYIVDDVVRRIQELLQGRI